VALLAAVATLVATGPGAAAPLSVRLERALRVPGIALGATGAVAIDVRTGKTVYGRNVALSLRPASNEKLAVALAALDQLGPGFRIATRVLGDGRLDGSVFRGALVLKGYGDPTVGSADLALLARRVEAAGVRRVTRAVVGDESYFDTRRTAPGWKPSFYKHESPPLSALVVGEGNVAGHVVDDPALAAARAFSRALRAEGVRVPRGARTGLARSGARTLATVLSARLSTIVRRMDRESDNFIAEVLLKALGARELGRGTTAAGASVVRRVLRERGVPLAGVRIVDGSGLSRYDRLTARAVAALLLSAGSDPEIASAFVRSLAIAGINGTLEDRLESPPARGVVRAKTGTTREASALSGYVRRRFVFSILQNGSPVPWWYARAGQDRFARILAAAR
jgi:serine-type D-Ala-D-Ala carboxypeptidase/endopeptidase (penicillin-binding protein 4)